MTIGLEKNPKVHRSLFFSCLYIAKRPVGEYEAMANRFSTQRAAHTKRSPRCRFSDSFTCSMVNMNNDIAVKSLAWFFKICPTTMATSPWLLRTNPTNWSYICHKIYPGFKWCACQSLCPQVICSLLCGSGGREGAASGNTPFVGRKADTFGVEGREGA